MIIAEVTLPTDDDAGPGWVTRASNERARRENQRLDGDPYTVGTAQQLFDNLKKPPGQNRWLWLVALPDGAPVGPQGELGLPTVPMADEGSLPPSPLLGELVGIEWSRSSMLSLHYVDVGGEDAELLGQFLREIDRICLARGLRHIGLYSLHPGVATEGLPEDVLSRGLSHAGFATEVVEWESRLALPVTPEHLAALADGARERARGYRIESFTGTIPRDDLADFADLFFQMRTAAPSGGMPVDSTPLTAEELGERDAQNFVDGGGRLTTLARHVDSHRVVGFSHVWLTERPLALQGDLLVDAGHRGHRLAALMKLRAFEELATSFPHVTRLQTVNAVENTSIRSLNVALGFEPARTIVGWSKSVLGEEG